MLTDIPRIGVIDCHEHDIAEHITNPRISWKFVSEMQFQV